MQKLPVRRPFPGDLRGIPSFLLFLTRRFNDLFLLLPLTYISVLLPFFSLFFIFPHTWAWGLVVPFTFPLVFNDVCSKPGALALV